jgi:hypothetical protein
MRITLATVAALLTASAASADDLVASSDDHALYIERVSSDKIETLYQEPIAAPETLGAQAWVWADARTLWVLRKQGDTRFAVAKIVDGKAEPARDITLADFKLKRAPVPIPDVADPEVLEPPSDGKLEPYVLATRDGQVWMAMCLAYKAFADCKMGYLRLDAPAPLATRRPTRVNDSEPELPAIPAPAGYTAALKTAKARGLTFRGAVCSGPHGDWVSNVLYEVMPPSNANFVNPNALKRMAQVQVFKLDWVRAAPPVLRYMLKRSSIVWAQYVEDCQESHSAPIPLESDRWIDGSVVRRPDGSELGSLVGGDRIAIAPRP